MRALALAVALLLAGGPAAAACRLALALGLDVSGSVNDEEYDLQRTGLAQALLAPEVQAAFLSFPENPAELAVFEWSGLHSRVAVLPWTVIGDAADLAAAASLLTTPGRRPREPETAVGLAMLHGAGLLAQRGDCWRRVLDISADGMSNIGPRPREARRDPRLGGVTINALVVGLQTPPMAGYREDSIAELSAYFRAEVIQGPDAFIQVALGYHDYRVAMQKKLLKELETTPVGWLAPVRRLAMLR